jgi:replicative DNA helicase
MKDVNAEYAVIAGILKYGNQGYAEVRDIVSPSAFTDIKSRMLYELCSKILDTQDKIDAATLISTAQSMRVSHEITSDLVQSVYNAHVEFESIRSLAKKVRKLEIITGAQVAARKSYDELGKLSGDENLDEILGALESNIFNFSNSIGDETGVKPLFKDIEKYVKELEESPCDIVGISTSFPTLDNAIGFGMRRGSVTLIGARTGVGKSMIGATVARFNAHDGVPILILDTEMSPEDNIQRYLAAQSKISLNTIARGTFSKDKSLKNKMWDAVDTLKGLPVFYKNIAGMQIDEVISLCRRWLMMEVGVVNGKCAEALIIWDYFKITDSKQLNSMSEHEVLGHQITKLSDFCQKYGATAMTFVQLNRSGITLEDMSAISQSDRLAWLASNVLFFKDKTEEEISECGEQWGNSKLIVLKARFGKGMAPGDCIYTQKHGEYSIIQECGTRFEMLKEKKSDEQDDD